MPEAPCKKCASCGFLVRRREGQADWEPCTEIHRSETGFDPTEHGLPHCSKSLADLHAEWVLEVGKIQVTPDRTKPLYPTAVANVLHRERDCPEWNKWNPLLSPKEHEMQQVYQIAQMKMEEAARVSQQAAATANRLALVSAVAAIFSSVFAAWLTWYLTSAAR